MKAGIENLGFVPSEADPCLFLHKKKRILLLLYVDDVLLFHEKEEVLQEVIADLQKGFSLTEEDTGTEDAFAYLGINLRFNGTKVTMTQDGLINKIFRTTGWETINGAKTPAEPKALVADRDGELFEADWEYASVVGMLTFLVNTRPDLQFAVHQCARFTHNPKMSHLKAVKQIVRYLKGTAFNGKDRGLTFDTGKKGDPLQMDCYVDADFAGLFNIEHNDDPVSSKSRSGFVIFLGNCPIIWQSRLQGETALSTTESEIIAMRMAMRELIWVRRLTKDVAETLECALDHNIKIKSKVFEDNTGAIALAHKEGVSSRTKHIHTKHWFFKEHIGEDKGITIHKIDTKEQLADVFTKGVEDKLFKPLRDKLMGWE